MSLKYTKWAFFCTLKNITTVERTNHIIKRKTSGYFWGMEMLNFRSVQISGALKSFKPLARIICEIQ